MKSFKSKMFFFFVTLIALSITAKVKTYTVKADAAIKGQQSAVIHSANISTDKVIKVPEKKAPAKTTSQSLSRGGKSLDVSYSAPPSAGRNDVVAYAYGLLGKPYVWGAIGPNAFDCSGFTAYVYRHFGISLPHYTGSQIGIGQAVSRTNLSPGDLVFFNTYGSISHVGIYIGGGSFIHAGNSRTGVIISSMSEGYYAARFAGARRVR